MLYNYTHMRTCCKCGGVAKPNNGYCREHHAEYMRASRKRHSELTDEQRSHANARAYLKIYVRRGKVVKAPCVVCGVAKVEGHHEDHSKPLEVVWLCRPHHVMVTRNRLSLIPWGSRCAETYRTVDLIQMCGK